MPGKVYIKTYGCQMNVYDSRRMADVLAPHGYEAVDEPRDAELVILNTCHIREKAAEKVYSDIGRMRQLKESYAARGGKMLIAVAGCVAQAEGREILARAPCVDLVLGPQTYHRLPEMIARALTDRGRLVDTEFPAETKFDYLPEEHAGTGPAAFLSIQEGCDRFCTFCVVPYTRGAEFSRPVAGIEAEARRLVGDGAREIMLLGQNVNAWHGEAADGTSWRLGKLIRHLSRIEGLKRIRYTTSHPRDVDGEQIAAHRDIAACMPYLHLPVQSGSDRILEAMNRGHTAREYLDIVDALRGARPDLALSSDFIVGFPGETEADFEATMDLVRKAKFAQAYSFKYSPRPGTPASALAGQVDDEIKSRRLTVLQAELNAGQRTFNESCVGRRLEVLLERMGRYDGQLVGRSPYLQAVHVSAPESMLGEIVSVDIREAMSNSLGGVLADLHPATAA